MGEDMDVRGEWVTLDQLITFCDLFTSQPWPALAAVCRAVRVKPATAKELLKRWRRAFPGRPSGAMVGSR